jgi:uncharacterized protein YkwD
MRLIGNILIFAFVVGTVYVLRADIAPLVKNISQQVEVFTETVLPNVPTANLFKEGDTEDTKITIEASDHQKNELTPISTEKVEAKKPVAPQKPTNTQTPGPLPAQTNSNSSVDTAAAISIAGIIAASNSERANAGLPALSENAQLNQSALAKVNDMLAKQYFEHVSPTGTTLDNLISKAGYTYITIGENLAYGNFTSSKEVVDAWMRSPGHRANILNSEYTEIGVGVRLGTYRGRQVWMLTQHFGLPSSACPSIDQKLKLEVQTRTAELDSMGAAIAAKKQQIDQTSQYTYEYEQLVKEYNQMVNTYNVLVAEVKIKIAEYNAIISAYNDCVQSHTGTN